MSQSGRWRRRDRLRLCDASNEASASSTLIHQRPPTPSCRGLSPYCGENSEPDRYSMESLTSNPKLENSLGPEWNVVELISCETPAPSIHGTVASSTEMRNSSNIQCARSFRRQRTTAVDRRNRSALNKPSERLSLPVIELGRLACRLAVNQTIRPLGVETENPVTDHLEPDVPIRAASVRRPPS